MLHVGAVWVSLINPLCTATTYDSETSKQSNPQLKVVSRETSAELDLTIITNRLDADKSAALGRTSQADIYLRPNNTVKPDF